MSIISDLAMLVNNNFDMPLNELFWENKTLVASDTILQAKTSNSPTGLSIYFKPKFDGALRMFATGHAPYRSGYFSVTNINTSEKIYRQELPYQEDVAYSVDISVKKGVTYSVSCDYANSVKIGGMIIDVNPIEVVE